MNQSTISVTTDHQRGLFILQAPFKAKDLIKKVPGRQWFPKDKLPPRGAWVLPKTGAAAANLKCLVSSSKFDLHADNKFLQLASEALLSLELNFRPASEFEELPRVKLKPFMHQNRGACLIDSRDATYLAWEMGTGKTKGVIDSILNMQGLSSILIVCPHRLVRLWAGEIAKHSESDCFHAAYLDKGTVAKRLKQAKEIQALGTQDKPAIVVINYEAVWRAAFGKWVCSIDWDMAVADEVHRTKSHKGRIGKFMDKLRPRAHKRVGLSGTPMPKDPLDLFSQMRFLDPGIFGMSYGAFKGRYAILGGFEGKQVFGFKHQDEMERKFYTIADRVKSDDVLDLPDMIHVKRPVQITGQHRTEYDKVSEFLSTEIAEGRVTYNNALTRLLRLQQITSGFVVNDDGDIIEADVNSKAEALKEYLEDLLDGEPVAVFCRFKHDLDVVHGIAKELGRKSSELSGRTDDLKDGVWVDGEDTILAVQVQAGGVGVDLTRARYGALFSIGYSNGDYEQLIKRVHRHGQTRKVVLTHFICEDTVDEAVYKAIETKGNVIRAVVDGLASRKRKANDE